MNDLDPEDIVSWTEAHLARELTEREMKVLQKTYIEEIESENEAMVAAWHEMDKLNAVLSRDIYWHERWSYAWMGIAIVATCIALVFGWR